MLFDGWSSNLANYSFPVEFIYARDLSLLLCLLYITFFKTKKYIPTLLYLIIILIYFLFVIITFSIPYDFFGTIHYGYRNLIFWFLALIIFSTSPVPNLGKTIDVILWTISIYIAVSLVFFGEYSYFGRNFGFFYNPNILGNFSILVIWYHFVNILTRNHVILNTIFIVIILAAFISTGSFTSYIMFVFMLFGMLFLLKRYRVINVRLIAITALAAGFVFSTFFLSGILNTTINRVNDVFSNLSTISNRVRQYEMLNDKISDASLLEVNFGINLYNKYTTHDSFYLQVLINHGVIGTVLVVLFYIILAMLLFQSLRVYKIHFCIRLVCIVSAIICWYAVNVSLGYFANSFVTKFPYNALFALIIGITISVLNQKRKDEYHSHFERHNS